MVFVLNKIQLNVNNSLIEIVELVEVELEISNIRSTYSMEFAFIRIELR